jgi:hypothetical protein
MGVAGAFQTDGAAARAGAVRMLVPIAPMMRKLR